MLLEVDGLAVRYGAVHAVRAVDVVLDEGEIVTVLGANGAGKSSLLNAIHGIVKLAAGKVRFGGTDITGWSTAKRVAAGLVLVPEGRRILISLTVREHLLMGAHYRNDDQQIAADMEDVFARFPNLYERRDLSASVLSGGEQQMLAIGRALLARPRLIMLDEPSLGLSPILVKQLFHIIHQLNEDGMTILLVEQNTRMALKAAHRGYVLELGRVVMEGKPEALLADKGLHEAYLGRSEKQDMPTKKALEL